MNVTLRLPEKADYETIASWIPDTSACVRWAGPLVPFPFAVQELPELISVVGGSSYCLSQNNDCIGFGQYWAVSEGAVHIGRIIISPTARGMGAGRLLVEKLMAQAVQTTRASTVTLRVYRDNEAALALYSSLGFTGVESESTGEVLFMRAMTDKIT
ncbi:MAG: GNAT family N-acetyltransferase [Natronospirillum sp.]